jgi:arylsulfatase A-like enzyme/Flp pilus assembly protein TadD
MRACRPWLLPLLLACASTGLTQTARPASPDVFLITIDTLRADHVHCYGYDQILTPALDALAKDGVRFTHAFTPSPITNTSHATILTGLLPSSHGVTDFAVPLSPAHPTLAESLKRRGYRTAAFIGAVILDSKSLAPGLDRGFDFYDNFPAKTDSKSRWGRVERRAGEVIDHASKWLAAHPTGPRFMWIHLYDPHDPYEPPPPYSSTYKDRPYDGEIAYADAQLARFLAILKKQGIYRNSLVVVAGDHGEGLGEHKEDTHGIFLYDSTIHVPLIIKLPASTNAGTVVNAQVRTTDILPTVVEVTGAGAPPRLDGTSLQPLLQAGSGPSRLALGETDYPLRFGWAPLRSIRTDQSKYIEAPRPEFYDLQSDPTEVKNIYAPWNSEVQKLRGQLAEVRAQQPPPASSAGAVGQSTIAELHALGYLGPADVGSSTTAAEPSLLPDPKDKIEEQNLLHRAMMATDDQRTDEARRALEQVLQMNPRSPTALLQLGQLELASANYAKAAQYLGRAREIRPDDAAAALHQGEALEKTGDLAGARDALEASLKLTPGQFAARLLLGQVYLRLRDAKAAQDQLEAALLLQPKSVPAQVELAKAFIAEGNYTEAVTRLEPLTKSAAATQEAWETLATAYEGLGKRDLAEQARARGKAAARPGAGRR